MRRALVLLLSLSPTAAVAAGRGETSLEAGPAFALLHQSTTRMGAGLGARILYGLSDAWSAHAGVTASWLPSSDGVPSSAITSSTVGMTAALDALAWVPFVELAVAFADLRGSGPSQQRLGGALGAGVDDLVSRHLTLSCRGQVDYLPLRLAGADVAAPVVLTLALYLGYVF